MAAPNPDGRRSPWARPRSSMRGSTAPGGTAPARPGHRTQSRNRRRYPQEPEEESWPSDASFDDEHPSRQHTRKHSIGSNWQHHRPGPVSGPPPGAGGGVATPFIYPAWPSNPPLTPTPYSNFAGHLPFQGPFAPPPSYPAVNSAFPFPPPVHPNPVQVYPAPAPAGFVYPAPVGFMESGYARGRPPLPTRHPSIRVPSVDPTTRYTAETIGGLRYRDHSRPRRPPSRASHYDAGDPRERVRGSEWDDYYSQPPDERQRGREGRRPAPAISVKKDKRSRHASKSRKLEEKIKVLVKDEVRKRTPAPRTPAPRAPPPPPPKEPSSTYADFDRRQLEWEHRMLFDRMMSGRGPEDVQSMMSRGSRQTADLSHMADAIELGEELARRRSRQPSQDAFNTLVDAMRHARVQEAQEYRPMPPSRSHTVAPPTGQTQAPSGFRSPALSQPFPPGNSQPPPQYWETDTLVDRGYGTGEDGYFPADQATTPATEANPMMPQPPFPRRPASSMATPAPYDQSYLFTPPDSATSSPDMPRDPRRFMTSSPVAPVPTNIMRVARAHGAHNAAGLEQPHIDRAAGRTRNHGRQRNRPRHAHVEDDSDSDGSDGVDLYRGGRSTPYAYTPTMSGRQTPAAAPMPPEPQRLHRTVEFERDAGAARGRSRHPRGPAPTQHHET